MTREHESYDNYIDLNKLASKYDRKFNPYDFQKKLKFLRNKSELKKKTENEDVSLNMKKKSQQIMSNRFDGISKAYDSFDIK